MQQLAIDYKIVFNSESGTRVMADLEEFCGYNKPCFYPGLPDKTLFELGQRNVVLRIKAVLAEGE